MFLANSLDQEQIIKAPQLDNNAFNFHLPAECFDGNFHLQPADMYSFGLILYEISTGVNPLRTLTTTRTKTGTDLATARFDPNLYDFSKVSCAIYNLFTRVLI